MLYRFRSTVLGKQILVVSEGPKDVVIDENGTTKALTIWYDADRYEAEAFLTLLRCVPCGTHENITI